MAKEPPVRVQPDQLRTLVRDIFAAAGTPAEDAGTVAEALVWANLRGIDSHGVSRVPRYLELFDSGESKPAAKLRLSRPKPGAILIDADGAPGPVALSRAMREAMAAARETGIAWAGVRGTVHTGAIGYYTSLAPSGGMVGIGLVAGIPNMAYHGARGAAIATSPISIAIPADRHPPLVLDMATAVMALGRMQQYKAQGKQLPEGAAMSAEGDVTTDPTRAVTPMPLGGPKGAGLSLAFELLTSGLMSNPIVTAFHQKTPEGRKHKQNASLIAIDIAAFTDPAAFRRTVDETLDTIKNLPRLSAEEEILIPGERGARTYAKRMSDGISVSADVWSSLKKATEKYGLSAPSP
ncbi:MAG TPA: Ldh family oxidoreductase [Stellaceae bacterium]|nr:Ldh family oxidoreductase [Stellaceae bacterium]